ncbi:citrate (Si)-synthase [Ignavibacteria bacterium]|jgi:citrate synthase|nr:citrate (Si)-synthase [Bacteroidota bacterium]MCZ2133297.1 citrate (Si)-synthase [Bacteroidota bacterium]
MQLFTSKLQAILPELRSKRTSLLKEHGDTKIASVAVEQTLGGMRAVPALLCETSSVSPDEGLRIRNIPILELTKYLPEDIFFLLCTGSLPNSAEREELRAAFAAHANVPSYVWDVLSAMPKDSHPMVMLGVGIMALERESAFRHAYDQGAPKDKLWEYALKDSVALLGSITSVAAGIYRMRFGKGERIAPDASLDWGANFAKMLGVSDAAEFTELIRLYLVLHSDHEGGNVSAMTAHTVSSALSDSYYSVCAGLNGLAGPLHGLANQECLRFIIDVRNHFGGVPADEQLREFAWNRLNNGQVIPGYGHAVLRVTDPRFTAFYRFAEEHNIQDENVQIVKKIFNIVPDVLREQGKAKNPWPNVDAASGSLLYAYGLTEFEFYTVMFGVSRAMGISSQILFHRMVGSPIVRPKSMTFAELESAAKA